MKNFQKLISARRKELKLTQKDLAEKLNVSDKTVSKWETGRGYPEITILSTLAKILEININELLEVEDFKERQIDSEKESYDYVVIGNYKNKIFITIGLIIAAIILSLLSAFIEDESLQVIVFGIGLISFVGGVIVFISNNISFRNFYTRKFYTLVYEYTYVKYSSIIIVTISIPFIFMTAYMSSSINLMTMGGLVNLFSIVMVIVSLLVINYIYRQANFKVKKDKVNLILGIIAFILFLATVTNLLNITFIPLLYSTLYILMFRKEYQKID